MKAYLAAQYHQKPEIEQYAIQLKNVGIEVTSSWLEEPHAPGTQMSDLTADWHEKYAQQDLLDIEDANILVFFSIPDTQLFRRGGRHVEFGYALGLGLPILVIGPKENIFHYLPTVKHVETWEEGLANLINRALGVQGS
jgi:hypothetical protein